MTSSSFEVQMRKIECVPGRRGRRASYRRGKWEVVKDCDSLEMAIKIRDSRAKLSSDYEYAVFKGTKKLIDHRGLDTSKVKDASYSDLDKAYRDAEHAAYGVTNEIKAKPEAVNYMADKIKRKAERKSTPYKKFRKAQ